MSEPFADAPFDSVTPPIDVYIDTNVFKFAVHHRSVYRGRPQSIEWGHIRDTVIVYELVETDELPQFKTEKLRTEARTLRLVADAARTGKIRLCTNSEVRIESWNLPGIDSIEGEFFGAEIADVPAPSQHSRIIAGPSFGSMKELQTNFLLKLKNKRFLEIQRITGAYQGSKKPNLNQLLDAFHLWCAEFNNCKYFLSMDFTLARVVAQSKRPVSCAIVAPTELADELSLYHPDFCKPFFE